MPRRFAYSAAPLLASLLAAGLGSSLGCGDDTTSAASSAASETGDGDPSTGDGDPSTGDGDPSTGDGDPSTGDGDPSTGDGDGDPSTGDGDGDGDPSTGDGDGEPACDLPTSDVAATLTGSLQPPGSCDDFVFTGTLEGGGGGVWNLDACPCNTFCFAPDPYVLTLTIPDARLIPDPVMCPRIAIRRDPETCALRSIVIGDLDQGGAPTWIASREDAAPAGVAELGVGLVDGFACDGFEQWSLELGWGEASLVLTQGQTDTLASDPPWTAANYASRTSPEDQSFAWVMAR